MLRVLPGLLTIVAVACGSAAATGPGTASGGRKPARTGPVYLPHELELARLEAKGAAAVPRLRTLAHDSDAAVRVRAIRVLGRVATPAAASVVRPLLDDVTPRVRAAAVSALAVGVPLLVDSQRAALARRLVTLLAHEQAGRVRAVALRALGRVGQATAVPIVARALEDQRAGSRVRAAAALALARMGRRKLDLRRDVRVVLRRIALAPGTAAALRWAATHALANEHAPAVDDHSTMFALTRLSRHAGASLRAEALRGLSRRYRPVAYDERKPFLVSLADRDWRVCVQAVRALAQPETDAEDHAALATWLVRELALYFAHGGRGPRIHPVSEGLRVLAPFAGEARVQTAADAVYQLVQRRLRALGNNRAPAMRRSLSMLHCLAAALRVRGGSSFGALAACGGARNRGWPNHLRRELELKAVAAGFGGTVRERFERMFGYASARDPRVRAAAVAALVTLIDRPTYHAVVMRALRAGVADRAVEVRGAVIDSLAKLRKLDAKAADALLAAALAKLRATAAPDPELHISLVGAFAAAKLRAAADVCRRAHTAANASVRHAGRLCLIALTGTDPGPGVAATAPPMPPVALESVVGYRMTWTLRTSRGVITIALDPASAPWHVAAVASLTRHRRYDGLLWHRVVADFVVQGGDPRGSGWGGPGYTLPAEPSRAAFATGAVGIADAGLHTGGSQLFIMHSPAPRLDNRYTRIGRVVSGQHVVDALIVGDRILSATIAAATGSSNTR